MEMLKLIRKFVQKKQADAAEKARRAAAAEQARQADEAEEARQAALAEHARKVAEDERARQIAEYGEFRGVPLRLHALAIERERPPVVSGNGQPTFLSAKEYVTVAFMETPVRFLADLPDLEPGDKVLREDGLIYTIAGDYDSLICSDGIYYDPITLMPYSDQEMAAVECEEYPIDNLFGLVMRSDRHRERHDDYYYEMKQKGQIAGEEGYTVEQARRAEIEMRKFHKVDELEYIARLALRD